MDLFDYMREQNKEKESPLASRLRPTKLEEVVGQQHIIGKDKLLYRAIKADKLQSVIFYGPPGTGKTTLAKLIAQTTSAEFMQINATSAGKKDMEAVIEKAKQLQGMYGKRTILFIDEINCVSETLAPAMLQFLQCKTFGNHKIPDGWLIVAAGNPPEYNKSVREFDVVTMDRIRKIEVEADFQVWKEYAYANGLHPAVISYLNTKKQNFYQMETTVDGRCFATPRGWEDLSTMIGIYEKIDKTIDREVVAQYIQHPKIAKDFANYLELFYKYRTDYQIEEIFKGNPDEILMKKVSHASFDERLAVLGLLISKVNERIRFAVEKEEEMELLQGTLIRYKESGQAEVSKDALELLEEVTAGLLFEEKQKKEAELLSRRQEQNYRRAGTLLETYLQRLRLEGSMDFETAFAKIKEWFEEENQKYLQMGQTAEQYLEYAFDFLEGTGLTGQEMVIFITELNSNARSVAFLQECESERYFRYNKELLFSEKREKILEKLN